MTKYSQKQRLCTINRYRSGIEFKVAYDVIESVYFAEFRGFCDVTGNFKLDFQKIGWLYQDAAFYFFIFWALPNGYLDWN